MNATCPHCHAALVVEPEMLGQVVNCPQCNKRIRFERPAEPTPQAQPAAAAVPRAKPIEQPAAASPPFTEAPRAPTPSAAPSFPVLIDSSRRSRFHYRRGGSLIDVDFQGFMAPTIIKAIYILSLVVATIIVMLLLIGTIYTVFTADEWFGVFAMLGIAGGYALGIIVWLLLVRLWLECAMVLFRIEEHLEAMVRKG